MVGEALPLYSPDSALCSAASTAGSISIGDPHASAGSFSRNFSAL